MKKYSNAWILINKKKKEKMHELPKKRSILARSILYEHFTKFFVFKNGIYNIYTPCLKRINTNRLIKLERLLYFLMKLMSVRFIRTLRNETITNLSNIILEPYKK